MDKNQVGTSAQCKSMDEVSQCILCPNNCKKVTIPENDPDVSLQELTSSLCRLIQLPADPFVNYFLQDYVSFCSQCTHVLQEIHRQLGNLIEIQEQLSKLKNIVRTELFLSTGKPKRGRPPKPLSRGNGGSPKLIVVTIDRIRKEIAQIIKEDKSPRIDLNALVHTNIIDDDVDDGGVVNMCETEIDEFEQKSNLLNSVCYSTTSAFEGLMEKEDVKVFASDVEAITDETEDKPRPKRKQILKNLYLDPSNSEGDNESVGSDWVPSEEENKSGKTTKRKKPKETSPNDPSEVLSCPFKGIKGCAAHFKLGEENFLAAHIRKIHEGVKNPYHCPHCSEAFPVPRRLDNHVRKIHTGEKPFMCEVCGKGFRLKEYLRIHSLSHTANERNFHCKSCPMSFFSYPSLRSHTQRKHVGVVFMCELCSVTFVSKLALKDHQRQKHYAELGLTPYKCEICEKIFSTEWYLRDHQKLHTGEGLLQCPTCDYRATNGLSLKGHLKKHNSEKPYKCTFKDCDDSFRYHTSLRRHLRKHTGARPFKCSSCTKCFTCRGQLQNHEGAIHSGLTPFECEHCGEKFPIRKYWQRHIKKHLNGKLSRPRVAPSLPTTSTVEYTVPPFNFENLHNNYEVGSQFL